MHEFTAHYAFVRRKLKDCLYSLCCLIIGTWAPNLLTGQVLVISWHPLCSQMSGNAREIRLPVLTNLHSLDEGVLSKVDKLV